MANRLHSVARRACTVQTMPTPLRGVGDCEEAPPFATTLRALASLIRGDSSGVQIEHSNLCQPAVGDDWLEYDENDTNALLEACLKVLHMLEAKIGRNELPVPPEAWAADSATTSTVR